MLYLYCAVHSNGTSKGRESAAELAQTSPAERAQCNSVKPIQLSSLSASSLSGSFVILPMCVRASSLEPSFSILTYPRLDWIELDLQEALSHAPPGLLHIRIHCSKKEKIPEDRLFDAEKDAEQPLGPPRFVLGDESSRAMEPREAVAIKFRAGRPRVDEILEEEIEMTAPEDWVSVGVCGPVSRRASSGRS